MERQKITLSREEIPAVFHRFLDNADIYDSSCSQAARVYLLDQDTGFFLKNAAKGTLKNEVLMTDYFYRKGFGPEVMVYESLESDWMLTRRVPGEDCTHPVYLEHPERLCDTIAQLLRTLHETSAHNCPIPNRTDSYLSTARYNYQTNQYHLQFPAAVHQFESVQAAWATVTEGANLLKTDTLLHGDYCLPNIILNNWRFSSFIDLDSAGIGDRHIDLFWGIWSLQFNLKTDRYRTRFLDAYGRDKVCEELLRTVAAVEVFG